MGGNGVWRQAVLERDDRECQLSKLFGIAELSGVPCSEVLEAHHKTYVNYGREELKDGITVCVRCHDILTDAVRRERMLRRDVALADCESQRPALEDREGANGGEIKIQDCRRVTPTYA